MHIGVAVYSAGGLSLEQLAERLDALEELEVGAAELRFGDVPLPAPDGRVERRHLAELADLASSYSFSLTCHTALVQDGFRLNLSHPSKPVRRRTRELVGSYLSACDAIGATLLVTHLGRLFPREGGELGAAEAAPPATRRERAAACGRVEEALRAVRELAAGSPVPLVIENSNPDPLQVSVFERPEEAEAGDYPVCLDIGHGWLAASHHGFEPESFARLLGGRIVHVHVHDNMGRVDPRGRIVPEEGLGDLHLPLGRGTCPAERFLAGLERFGGAAVLEHAVFDPDDFRPAARRLGALWPA